MKLRDIISQHKNAKLLIVAIERYMDKEWVIYPNEKLCARGAYGPAPIEGLYNEDMILVDELSIDNREFLYYMITKG